MQRSFVSAASASLAPPLSSHHQQTQEEEEARCGGCAVKHGQGWGTKWFEARISWPYREVPQHPVVRERMRVASSMPIQPGAEQWQLVGPTNVGGRMTSIVCGPVNSDQIVAGSAGGGVWRSGDGGQSWQALWHKQATLNIGALAIDPSNPATIYCGTGEANLSADPYPGVGIFRTLDGVNWQLLAGAEAAAIPTRIGAIAVDPFDRDHIRLGGVSHAAGNTGVDGMFVSRDGGMTWTRDQIVAGGSYRCHAIVFHPGKRSTCLQPSAPEASRMRSGTPLTEGSPGRI